MRSTIGRVTNITKAGNYKLGNFCRFTVIGKSNKSYTIEHIQRNQNKKADSLSKLASMAFKVLVEVLSKRSIKEKEILHVETKEGESWMTPIHEYLVSGLLPEDPKESKKIMLKAPQYKLIRGNLYRRSFYTPWLHCVASPQTDNIVKEVHEGSCGFNAEPQSMVVRITKQGYYWPSMHWDAAKVLQDCEKCKGAIRDKETPRGFKFLAIAIEHSMKWVEAKPLTDEKHFQEGIFADLCKGLKVTQSFSLITEHMEIMNHIKKQLAQSQQGWVDDLAQVLWVHRMLPRNSQKETPFSLTYGSEAIILISKNDVAKDDRERIKEVDKRRESKEIASIEEAYYRSKLRMHHNKRSSHFIYKIGDFILHLQNNTRSMEVWQGPYMISEVHGGGLYKIVDASDHSLTQTAKSTSLLTFNEVDRIEASQRRHLQEETSDWRLEQRME
ncbi:reverse transcriptase domain-containing protein [Tanacetum coccineum]